MKTGAELTSETLGTPVLFRVGPSGHIPWIYGSAQHLLQNNKVNFTVVLHVYYLKAAILHLTSDSDRILSCSYRGRFPLVLLSIKVLEF
jgi:hypothetical protein